MKNEQLLTLTRQLEAMDDALTAHAKAKASMLEKQEVYFDEENDLQERSTYYQDIDFEKKELIVSFQKLLENTHTTPLRYNPSRYVYPWVDLQPDGTLKSIYSGVQRTAEEVIIEDYETSLKRKKELEKLEENRDSIQSFAQIEHTFKYNCEHVVPQSWFGAREPMRGDLHHLFTCEPVCNSIRGNHPYVDFKDYTPEEAQLSKITAGCGKAENKLFEPEYAKGIVARAMLYFLVRYPDKLSSGFKNGIDIRLLLRWHKDFPPGVYEKHRNQAIYELQGNRNPFIDFPEKAAQLTESLLS
ncbi:endonuclease I family protein [Jeotgalibacillus proteolyticus]|uniref:Endonuclease I n=1 Tax=Jeotgalibacillus proteolyticus TaxID=2082395 RepID=A0A2S5G8F5_9BACL|nr:endonuclease [Jeotgalibacillus proteolyticus]PPA69287.1 endonuclease I [Jeotgalibacillus proteolyticus]